MLVICSCKWDCSNKIAESDLLNIFTKFYSLSSKDMQDMYLTGLMECSDVRRRRRHKTTDHSRTRDSSFKYYVSVGKKRWHVCQVMFTSLFCISKKRLHRLQQCMAAGNTPADKRGKHNNRANKVPEETLSKIKSHIDSFPVKESHYGDKHLKYLDARLTISKMHKMFQDKHPQVKVTREFYRAFFRKNYSLRFGRPQVDVCSMCELLRTNCKSAKTDKQRLEAESKLKIHNMRAKKFYRKLDSVTKVCKEDKTVAAVSFDFMQNLPLPNIPVQEVFYFRQLWVNTFGIHNLGTDDVRLYVYHEGQGRKSPDEVCTFLHDYIMKYVNCNVKTFYLFCDGCAGQNKNNTVIRYLCSLIDARKFLKIVQIFPFRGHSFLPCDRDFGLIKRITKKADRVYSVEEYTEMMTRARAHNPFAVTNVKPTDILDFKNWWPKYYKKSSTSADKQKWSPSTYKMLVYSADTRGAVTVYEFIDGLISTQFGLVKSARTAVKHTMKAAYDKSGVGINIKKLADIEKLRQYIPEQHTEFYTKVASWKSTDNDIADCTDD